VHSLLFAFLSLIGMAAVVMLAAKLMDDRALRRVWDSLAAASDGERFTESMVRDLPDPARRYLLHAIQPGTRLAASVQLSMEGTFRLRADKPWMEMRAEQIIAVPHGFVWTARIGRGLMQLTASDHLVGGEGLLQARLWGVLPALKSSGENCSRSQIGRLAVESLMLPSSLLPSRGVHWEAPDDVTAIARFRIEEETVELRITVAPDGRPLSVTLPRWGTKTEDGSWGYEIFGGILTAESSFAGYRIPTALRAGWHFGTDRYFEFFTATIHSAEFK